MSIIEILKLDTALFSPNSLCPVSLPILIRTVTVKSKLAMLFKDNWRKEKDKLNCGKLRTYFTFKFSTQFEYYLRSIDSFVNT